MAHINFQLRLQLRSIMFFTEGSLSDYVNLVSAAQGEFLRTTVNLIRVIATLIQLIANLLRPQAHAVIVAAERPCWWAGKFDLKTKIFKTFNVVNFRVTKTDICSIS